MILSAKRNTCLDLFRLTWNGKFKQKRYEGTEVVKGNANYTNKYIIFMDHHHHQNLVVTLCWDQTNYMILFCSFLLSTPNPNIGGGLH